MDNLDYIESYFTNEPDLARTREFEERIESDPAFAEEVAFYLSALKVAREESEAEKKQHFKVLYQKDLVAGDEPVLKTYGYSPLENTTATPKPRTISNNPLVRKLVYYMAAAAVVAGLIFGTYTLINPVSPQQLASEYEKEHLQTLPVTMSSRSNSIQTGLQLYNERKFTEALLHFEKIIQSDTSDSDTSHFDAKKYAGIAALQLKEYNKALSYFEQLEIYDRFSNPALIFQSVTLMDRNQPGDAAKAKLLLKKIVDNDLEEKELAQEWLKKM